MDDGLLCRVLHPLKFLKEFQKKKNNVPYEKVRMYCSETAPLLFLKEMRNRLLNIYHNKTPWGEVVVKRTHLDLFG